MEIHDKKSRHLSNQEALKYTVKWSRSRTLVYTIQPRDPVRLITKDNFIVLGILSTLYINLESG